MTPDRRTRTPTTATAGRSCTSTRQRHDNSKMPFSALNALPRKLAAAARPGLAAAPPGDGRVRPVRDGRLRAVLLAWLVFRWARELYGPAAGLLALTLFVFDPNILAHGGARHDRPLCGLDDGARRVVLLAIPEPRGARGVARRRRSARPLFGAGPARQVHVRPTWCRSCVLIALGHAAPELWALARAGTWRAVGRAVRRGREVRGALRRGVPGRREHRVLGPGHVPGCWRLASSGRASSGTSRRRSGRCRASGCRCPGVHRGPGLGARQRALGGDNVYLLGQVGRTACPAGAFPSTTPSRGSTRSPSPPSSSCSWRSWPTCSASGGSTSAETSGHCCARSCSSPGTSRSCSTPDRVPVRAGRAAVPVRVHREPPARCGDDGARPRLLIGGLVLYLVVSVLSYYPHFIPYFNELVWDRTKAYRILVDSNLGWSQNQLVPPAIPPPPPRRPLRAGWTAGRHDRRVGQQVRRAVVRRSGTAGSGRTSSPSGTSPTGT